MAEKKELVSRLPLSKLKNNFFLGTGFNSLNDNLEFIKYSIEYDFKTFLIMPPAYYKYGDKEVIEFYSKIVEVISDCEIVLYNFEKLCGYKFSIECIEELVKKYPKNIIGVKDSSYNLFENLKIDNFSVLPGSESKLFKGLQLGCSGIITATCNATSMLARKVYDDFNDGKDQTVNQNLCDVRAKFEKYNLISGLHTFCSQENEIYKNVLPPLSILNQSDQKNLISYMNKLNDYFVKNMNEGKSQDSINYLKSRNLEGMDIKEFKIGFAEKNESDTLKFMNTLGISKNELKNLGLLSDKGLSLIHI